MKNSHILRVIALGGLAAFCLGASAAEAADVNTADFIAACSSDVSVTDDPAFEDGSVTPKAYCECVAGELVNSKLGQKDVDMLTKMHKEEISDEDVEKYPTLEDLLNANEGYEDACRQRLGLPTDSGTDGEEEDEMEEGMPEDNASPPE
jgi:hypothetical protein